ncbi:DUF4913 domain-containing protein (plasmid) [Streptosporangium sp. CA-135522]|uniref:DUF4913 domain-containing protein n=1 Tax=Streptosporangium sp. CA-135522 TaxID=3240072 RepID=UPI003D919304
MDGLAGTHHSRLGRLHRPQTWHDEHLEPALAVLRSPEGPLAGCMTDPDKPRHRPAAHAPLAASPSEG